MVFSLYVLSTYLFANAIFHKRITMTLHTFDHSHIEMCGDITWFSADLRLLIIKYSTFETRNSIRCLNKYWYQLFIDNFEHYTLYPLPSRTDDLEIVLRYLNNGLKYHFVDENSHYDKILEICRDYCQKNIVSLVNFYFRYNNGAIKMIRDARNCKICIPIVSKHVTNGIGNYYMCTLIFK